MHRLFLKQISLRLIGLRLSRILALATLLVPCGPVTYAQAQEAPTLVPPVRPFRLPARVGVFGEAQISLQQALASALANNNDIDASRIDREISGYNLTGARGLFDPPIPALTPFPNHVTPVPSPPAAS